MTLSASEEIEQLAIKAATEAIQLESQGLWKMALPKYQNAIGMLKKLCAIYPNSSQHKIYNDYITQYEKRVRELKGQETTQSKGKTVKKNLVDDMIFREKPNTKWSDVVGLDIAKKAIEDAIIYPCKRSDLFPLGWPRGILLFGPPGCGKTLIAAATACEINAEFYNVDAASIMSKWLGESERKVAHLFESARLTSNRGKAAIIFMDEIDSLIGARAEEVGGEVRMRNQFMKEMDSIVDKSKKLLIYIIGATNKPWSLDESFIRRFQKRIYIPLPDVDTRRGLFEFYSRQLLKLGKDVNFDELAKTTGGYSGSDINDIVQAVHLKAVREFFTECNPNDSQAKLRPIVMKDFSDVLMERRPSVSKETLLKYDSWYRDNKAL
ncbi:MAG: ATP-binding protein [Candidatus Bathyarchaeota archaeon]